LTGTGHGQLDIVSGDVVSRVDATMLLMGETDVQPPTLQLFGDVDPFAPFALSAPEPLPATASLAVRAPDGEVMALSPGGMAGVFVTSFQTGPKNLRYATQYELVADGLTDFAGNAATSTTFTTSPPPPPLAAEDGFESVTGATSGGVQVLSGAGEPTITGAKSLYIFPVAGAPQPTLTVRLPIATGDTSLIFTYRKVALRGAEFFDRASWRLGSEGGAAVAPTLPANSGPWTDATIGGTPVTLGPITTASIALPADVTNEVVLQRVSNGSPCGYPLPNDGMIIDDLRVE
jgi:hypothetical protein